MSCLFFSPLCSAGAVTSSCCTALPSASTTSTPSSQSVAPSSLPVSEEAGLLSGVTQTGTCMPHTSLATASAREAPAPAPCGRVLPSLVAEEEFPRNQVAVVQTLSPEEQIAAVAALSPTFVPGLAAAPIVPMASTYVANNCPRCQSQCAAVREVCVVCLFMVPTCIGYISCFRLSADFMQSDRQYVRCCEKGVS